MFHIIQLVVTFLQVTNEFLFCSSIERKEIAVASLSEAGEINMTVMSVNIFV